MQNPLAGTDVIAVRLGQHTPSSGWDRLSLLESGPSHWTLRALETGSTHPGGVPCREGECEAGGRVLSEQRHETTLPGRAVAPQLWTTRRLLVGHDIISEGDDTFDL